MCVKIRKEIDGVIVELLPNKKLQCVLPSGMTGKQFKEWNINNRLEILRFRKSGNHEKRE